MQFGHSRLVAPIVESKGFFAIFKLACIASVRADMVSLRLGVMMAAYDSLGTISS